jgi:hypothetical protein
MVGHHRYGLSLDSSSKVRSVLYLLQHLSRRHLYVVIALLQPGSTFRTSHVGLYLSAD